MSNQYFPPYSSFENIKVDLDLSNYTIKKDLYDITHADTFALKANLSTLKTEVDKLDIPKFSNVPDDLSKLTKQVQEDFTKKTDFDTLKTKFDSTDTTKYVLKTKYDTKVGDLKLKIPDVKGLLQKSTFNSKITEIEGKITTAEGKIPDISGLATNTAASSVENKILDISGLATKTETTAVKNKIHDVNGFVKKTDCATEITNIKNDYATKAILDSKLSEL